MLDREPEALIAFSTRLYRLLLAFYPRGHRREYGPLMAQAFRDLCRDMYRQSRVAGIFTLWSRTLLDVAASAVIEHLAALRAGVTDKELMTMNETLHHWRIRQVAMIAVLASLFAPWYHFSDGGTFSGWLALLSGVLCVFGLRDVTAHSLLLLLMAASLSTATLVGLRLIPQADRASRWQPVFLLLALPCPIAYGWPGWPGVLWGVWLAAACIAIAVALELGMRVGARRQQGL